MSDNRFLEKAKRSGAILVDGGNGFPELRRVDFANGRRRDLRDESLPEIVTPDATSGRAEWGRYHDAVREAARSFDNPQEGDIHHFLNARARNPERVDAKAFHEAVKRQRMADMVDIVDHHMRRDGSLPRGARMVRTQAPRGYMRRALRHTSSEDLAHLRHRLVSIGHPQERVDEYLSGRVAPDIWDQATNYDVRFSEGEFEGLIFDMDNVDQGIDVEWSDEIREIVKELPQPVINVYVTTPERGDKE